MRKLARGFGAAAIIGALLVATGGIAHAKEVSNGKYAKQLCGTLNGVIDEVSNVEPSESTDPATFQTETVASVDTLIAQIDKANAKLKKISPEDGGKKVTKLFTKYLNELKGNIQDARDEFAAADPNSPAFPTGPLTMLTVGLQNSAIGIDDPFAKLSPNQDLLGAFDDEGSCEDIVTII